jgi:hypothetical protein
VLANRKLTPEEDWQLACHEAGHAVLCVRRGIPFGYALHGEGGHGVVVFKHGWFEDPGKVHSPDEIESLRLYHAGGAAAEELLFVGHREDAARHDRKLHADLEKRRRPQREDGWQQDLQAASRVLDCASVLKVAVALHREKKLDEAEIYRILGCKPP